MSFLQTQTNYSAKGSDFSNMNFSLVTGPRNVSQRKSLLAGLKPNRTNMTKLRPQLPHSGEGNRIHRISTNGSPESRTNNKLNRFIVPPFLLSLWNFPSLIPIHNQNSNKTLKFFFQKLISCFQDLY